MFRIGKMSLPFYSPDDMGGNPSTAGGDTSAPTSAPVDTGAPVAQPTTQAAPAAPAAPAQSEPSWLRGRLDEVRQATLRQAQNQWQQERQQLQSQYEATQRQLHALVGVGPQEDPETAAVRTQFQKLYPGLAQIEQRAKDILGSLESQGGTQAQVQHYWGDYGRRTMDRLYDMAGKSLGSGLSDEAKGALHASFAGYVQSSPELVERYMNDPSLVDEFWNRFETSFIGPVRRTSAAAVQGAGITGQRLPQDAPSGAPQMTGQPAQPKNLDERAAMSWAAFNASKNQQ